MVEDAAGGGALHRGERAARYDDGCPGGAVREARPGRAGPGDAPEGLQRLLSRSRDSGEEGRRPSQASLCGYRTRCATARSR
eukprot:560022-Heterocapsa_arctica.AAC.1